MTTRISVTPDGNGIVRITCDGADLELYVQPPATGGSSGSSAGPSGIATGDHSTHTVLSFTGPQWHLDRAPPRGDHLEIHADVIDVHKLHGLAQHMDASQSEAAQAEVKIHLRTPGKSF